jgi:hypothetical protein
MQRQFGIGPLDYRARFGGPGGLPAQATGYAARAGVFLLKTIPN